MSTSNAIELTEVSTADTPAIPPGLSVGRIVHFVENQAERRHFAAIIVTVHPNHTVDLHVFGATGSFMQRAVPYSEDTAAKRTWHRPEYVA